MRVLLAHLQHRLGQRLAEFVDGVKVNTLAITRGQHRLRQRLQVICGRLAFELKAVLCDERGQRRLVGMLFQQSQGGAVINTGGDRDAGLQRCALGLIFEARLSHRTGARPDEIEPGALHRGHHLLVFGHEAVPGKNRVVTVGMRNGDNIGNALLSFFLGGAAVVGNPVHAARIRQHPELGRERAPIHNRVLLGEQNAVPVDAHFGEHVHGFFTDRSSTDNQRLQMVATELLRPLRAAQLAATIAVYQRIIEVVLGTQGVYSRPSISGIRAEPLASVPACNVSDKKPSEWPAFCAGPPA